MGTFFARNGRHLRSLVLMASILGGGAAAAAAEPLELLITERPPYYVVDTDGAVSGVVAGRAVDAFAAAGLDVKWTVVSFNRQLQLIADNGAPLCGIGWFKNPEREAFAKFTDAIYQDKALIALSRSDNRGVAAHFSLRGLMGDEALTMGRKLGFSYGAVVDDLIETLSPMSITTDQSNIGMTRMLIGRRFDYMIAAPEEAAHLIASLGDDGETVTKIELKDLPPQNRRYIMCSQRVGDDVIAALNAAIQRLGD